jgi:hypothetical protein
MNNNNYREEEEQEQEQEEKSGTNLVRRFRSLLLAKRIAW